MLCQIAKILDELKIPYITTGGMAVAIWGKPRFTADIDIVIELLPENIPLLVKKLLAIDKSVYVDELSIKEAFYRKAEFNFIHPNTGLKVDFWVLKNDSFDEERINNPIIKEINGQAVKFISPEGLILSKLLWCQHNESAKQIRDIEVILKITKVDMDYIKKWAKQHSTLEIFENILKELKNYEK